MPSTGTAFLPRPSAPKPARVLIADDVTGGDEEDDDGGDNDNVAELPHHR